MAGLPNSPRKKRWSSARRRERVGRHLLRHQPDQRARGAVVANNIVAVDGDLAGSRIDDAADDADQRRLAGAVRAEQSENLAAPDLQVDVLERLEAAGVDFREMRDGNGGGHDC